MRKIVTIVVIVLLLGIATLYLYDVDEKPIYEDELGAAYITGNIYDISEEGILVAEGVEDEDDYGIMFTGKAIWLSINAETRIINDKEEDVLFDELMLGQRVTAWTTGLIAESYPEQGTAKLIMIEKEEVLASCYVGGCSSELCTSDKEVMSTCELLPGMECLNEEMTCEMIEGECTWVLSVEAAKCFMEVEEKEGTQARESRIGNLFEKAEKLLE
jgi:eight-cysteine-cluster-containing protein